MFIAISIDIGKYIFFKDFRIWLKFDDIIKLLCFLYNKKQNEYIYILSSILNWFNLQILFYTIITDLLKYDGVIT